MRAMAIQRPRTAAAQARQAKAAAAAAATTRRAGVQPERATARSATLAAAVAAAAMAAPLPRLWQTMAAGAHHRGARLLAEVLTPRRQRRRAATPSRWARCSSRSTVC